MIHLILQLERSIYFYNISIYIVTISQSFAVNDRKEAAFLLAEKLLHLKDTEAVIIAVSHGGAVIGYHLAKRLRLPFEVALCKKLMHPGDKEKSIGSISADEVIIHDDEHNIPRDYIYHQIILNQNAIKAQRAYYGPVLKPLAVRDRCIVVVVDTLVSHDSVIASLKSLRKQGPKEIIVASSLATPEAISKLSFKADDVVILAAENDIKPRKFYQEHPTISDEDVKTLITKANERN